MARGNAAETARQRRRCLRPSYLRGIGDDAGFRVGIFRVRFSLFTLGALIAGIAWIGMYAGISYFLGEEIAHRVRAPGTNGG